MNCASRQTIGFCNPLPIPCSEISLFSSPSKTITLKGYRILIFNRVKGFKLINFVRKQESADELKKKYGDINVIVADNKNDEKVIEQVKKLTNGKGANYGKHFELIFEITLKLPFKAMMY